jgi:hypothetical protein
MLSRRAAPLAIGLAPRNNPALVWFSVIRWSELTTCFREVIVTFDQFSMEWQKLNRKDLFEAGWEEVSDSKTGRTWWRHSDIPEEYSFEGAKYTQGVIDRQGGRGA